jgi:uncharacterized repeat protein (TIGR04138 family)
MEWPRSDIDVRSENINIRARFRSSTLSMQDSEFSEVVALICKDDPRFDRRVYEFVRLGLDHTVKELRKKDAARAERSRHVSGRELVEGLRAFALEQYGPMAKTVLNSWGVSRSRDFGDIVFNLIEYKVFSKTESDRQEDFDAIFDFDDAFVKPFLPARRQGVSP